MRDTASEPLAVYMFGKTLSKTTYRKPLDNMRKLVADHSTAAQAETPEFRTALWRYYQDTINYQGAMQFLPRFLEG